MNLDKIDFNKEVNIFLAFGLIAAFTFVIGVALVMELNSFPKSSAAGMPPAPVAHCGTAARAYLFSNVSLAGTRCTFGASNPANPAFPSQGDSKNWYCGSELCTATRAIQPGRPHTSVCGPAAKVYSSSETKFVLNLCNSGIQNPSSASNPVFPAPGGSAAWSCRGTTVSNCTATRSPVSVNGACGTANGKSFYNSPNNPNGDVGSFTMCSAGSNGTVTASGDGLLWLWPCYGVGNGTTANCSANKKTDGVCGSADKGSFSSVPSDEAMCSAGLPGEVSGTGPWTWSCNGLNGGKSVNCSANRIAGSLSASLGSSNPPSQAVAGNQKITAATFKFTASNDTFNIAELKVATFVSGASSIINSATLKDGGTILATVPFVSDVAYFTGLNIQVPSNTTKTLTVNLSLGVPYTDGTTVTTGKNVKLALTYFKAINSQGVAGTQTVNVAGNNVYVYKSTPTFTVGSVSGQGPNLSMGSPTNLYNFAVSADPNGAIAIRQLKFNVTINKNSSNGAPKLNNFKFFRGSTDITNLVTIQTDTGESLEGTSSSSLGTGTYFVVTTFDTEEVIPAVSSQFYTLKASPSGFKVNDSVNTYLLTDSYPSADLALYYLSSFSDTAVQTLYTSANHGGGDTTENVIWSDMSAKVHDYSHSASSPDWFNGWLLNNFSSNVVIVIAQ